MLNSKQRAKLRGIANNLQATVHIGKNGLTDEVLSQIKEDITANELIKIKLLETCPISLHDTADTVSKRIKADVVATIGNKFVLYKKNHKKKEGIVF